MNEKTDSAVTAAELDELERRLNAGGYYLTEKPTHLEAGAAIASLRKQLDEAQHKLAIAKMKDDEAIEQRDEAQREVWRLDASNAQMAAALRKARLDLSEYGEAWTQAMIEAVQRDLDAALAQPAPAPASPSPGLREQIAENANCSGLREAVIEECAKIADAEAAEQDELDLEGTMRAETVDHIADRIRALASRPVSEREGQQ